MYYIIWWWGCWYFWYDCSILNSVLPSTISCCWIASITITLNCQQVKCNLYYYSFFSIIFKIMQCGYFLIIKCLGMTVEPILALTCINSFGQSTRREPACNKYLQLFVLEPRQCYPVGLPSHTITSCVCGCSEKHGDFEIVWCKPNIIYNVHINPSM